MEENIIMVDEDVVADVDLTQRTDDEWSDIYHVQLVDAVIDTEPINEFAWAYKLCHSQYFPRPAKLKKGEVYNYDMAEQMEMRAMKINRDLYTTADKAEKQILDNGTYIQTKYVLDYRVKR